MHTALKIHDVNVTVDPSMPDLRKTPFAIKKAEKARAFIAKYGLPKEDKPKKVK
jgi:hypothetical protein